jgi:hypothetical protein
MQSDFVYTIAKLRQYNAQDFDDFAAIKFGPIAVIEHPSFQHSECLIFQVKLHFLFVAALHFLTISVESALYVLLIGRV